MKDSQINPQEHSEIKVELLRLYLEKYISILSLAPGVKEVELYDLFCGEGIYANNKEGSPVIILKLIKDIWQRNRGTSNPLVKFNCNFNDFDGNKIKKLSNYILNQKIHDPQIGSLNYHNENYQIIKERLINNPKKSGQKTFIFIDPYGYKDISIKDIEGLLADSHTEVLLFLPTQHMYRFERDGTPPSLYNFLTDVMSKEELDKSVEPNKSDSSIAFINKIRDGFGNKLKGRHYVDSFIISREVNNYFALFFFTSHLYGFEKFLEAKWQIDEEEGRGWSPTFNKGRDLFSSAVEVKPNTDKFEQNLKYFLKDKRSNIEIHKFTIENRHLTKHTVQILKNLQNETKLEVLLPNNTNARKGSFYIGWTDVRSKMAKSYIKIK